MFDCIFSTPPILKSTPPIRSIFLVYHLYNINFSHHKIESELSKITKIMKRILLVLCGLPQEISGFLDGITTKARVSLSWNLENVRTLHIIDQENDTLP